MSSIIVIVGVKLSSRKADKEHPFGHGRWEHIASIFIGILLGIIAYEFLKESLSQIKMKESANFGTVAVVVTIISVVIKEALAQYAFFLARKTNNSSVKADGWHHRTDALSSVVILIGIAFKNKFWWIDSVLGIIVSLMLFYAAYEILKESIDKIIGENPSAELIGKIKEIISGLYGTDLVPHHFHIHNYISQKELSFHIKMDKNVSIEKGHSIATSIEEKIYSELDIHATIHIEPLKFEHTFD
jgi:cation diffusion facilitator family transporter